MPGQRPRDGRGDLPLRDRKKAATRDDLIRIARERFLRDGYDATGVDAIADEAGVSTRTLFRYFPTKFDLAFPFHRERLARFQAALDRRFDRDRPFAGLAAALRDLAAEQEADREALLAESRIANGSRELESRTLAFDADFRKAVVATLGRAGVPGRQAAVLGGMVFGAVLAALSEWYRGGGREPLARSARIALDAIERLGEAPAGRRRAG